MLFKLWIRKWSSYDCNVWYDSTKPNNLPVFDSKARVHGISNLCWWNHWQNHQKIEWFYNPLLYNNGTWFDAVLMIWMGEKSIDHHSHINWNSHEFSEFLWNSSEYSEFGFDKFHIQVDAIIKSIVCNIISCWCQVYNTQVRTYWSRIYDPEHCLVIFDL